MKKYENSLKSKEVIIILALILVSFNLFGCGSSLILDEKQSPQLSNVELSGRNDGDEDSQYVDLILDFDKSISINDSRKDSLNITIANKKVDDFSMEKTADNQVKLSVKTTSVTDGKIKVEDADEAEGVEAITDESGKYSAGDFNVSAIIPSGIELSTVDRGAGYVTKKVDSLWNIRSILWIRILKDGEPISAGQDENLKIMDGAIAIHGHDFLNMDEEMTAKEIAKSINEYFSDSYECESKDGNITLKLKNNSEEKLDIQVYTYCEY
ncbi:hypothetical protein SAMN05216249_10641 [Acetitomaculum ruminis DSM 5522]|uniref:Uncharacterized protein n=1 Tax=Acetitomaculum ruminis DSM 5522 TaxID=1120918 RepID=A0A1I0XAM4_9FIRM|nr:hypothetical protein [Acetitomaculum ruminis]SFA97727.1 hypothetical protein SAMN05216249_10641 [Acetitomaculum ruminis DSM 5522]